MLWKVTLTYKEALPSIFITLKEERVDSDVAANATTDYLSEKSTHLRKNGTILRLWNRRCDLFNEVNDIYRKLQVVAMCVRTRLFVLSV